MADKKNRGVRGTVVRDSDGRVIGGHGKLNRPGYDARTEETHTRIGTGRGGTSVWRSKRKPS